MSTLANKIGVPHSNFSKYVKVLKEKGLIERFRKANNSKDVIIKLTDRGREFYRLRSRWMEEHYQELFAVLDNISDEQLVVFSEVIEKMTDTYTPFQNEGNELIKEE